MIITILILLVISVFLLMISADNEGNEWLDAISALLIIVCIILLIINSCKPTPIDVYKDKTQIVLKENAVGNLDTLIVWKK